MPFIGVDTGAPGQVLSILFRSIREFGIRRFYEEICGRTLKQQTSGESAG
jgi:hypothetical protein